MFNGWCNEDFCLLVSSCLQAVRKSPQEEREESWIRAKLTQLGPKAIPLPSLLLTKVWSQENKMDELRL